MQLELLEEENRVAVERDSHPVKPEQMEITIAILAKLIAQAYQQKKTTKENNDGQ